MISYCCDTLSSMKIVKFQSKQFSLIAFFLFLLGSFVFEAFTTEKFHLSEDVLAGAEKRYGSSARQRLNNWVELINTDTSTTDMEKLEKVNTFFNKLDFVDDLMHWRQQDYWATPVEFLASDGGDCEDFSLAKYSDSLLSCLINNASTSASGTFFARNSFLSC